MRNKYKNETLLREFIKQIPKLSNKLSYYQFTRILDETLLSIPIQIENFTNENFFFNQKEFNGLNVIYRARVIKNSIYDKVSDISYIPKTKLNKIKTFGRLNKINETIFYGALNYEVACAEVLTKDNIFKKTNSVMLVVGVWRFKHPLNFAIIPYSEKAFIEVYEKVSYNPNKISLETIRTLNNNLINKFDSPIDNELLTFFANEFAKYDTMQNSDYFATNYYADRIFNRLGKYKVGKKIDGILYPSVAFTYQSNNIALLPSVVDNHLEFIEAMLVWVINENNHIRFIPVKQHILADKYGNIKWNNN